MRTLVILLFITTINALCQNSSGKAVVFHSSLTGVAGDVIYLQGSGFGTSPHVQYSFNDNNWTALTPLTSGESAVTVQLPINQTRLPDLIAVEVSPDGSNWSAPTYVNQALAYSFDTNQVGPGNRFRIFGRNLIFARTPTVRFVDTGSGQSYSGTVDTADSTAYALVAFAPNGIQANHTYSVYVSNGYNGNSTSGGETVAGKTLQGRNSGSDYWNLSVPWAADLNFTNNVYNVQTDPRLAQHASGNGSQSDMGVIAAAILAASNDGGGIVYLPAGTYDLYFQNGCGIALFPRVALVGAGAGKTFVNWGFGPAPGVGTGYAVCFAQYQSGVSDITFTNQSNNWPESAIGQGVTELFIQRTNWNIGTAQWLVLAQDSNLTVQNTRIIQGNDQSYNGPLNASYSTNLILRGDTIQYVGGSIQFDGVQGGVLENSSIIRDASYSIPQNVISHVLTGNWTQDFMILQNQFSVTGGTLPQRNDGEIAGSEAGGGIRYDEFRGTITYTGSNVITDESQNFNWSPSMAVPHLRVGAILAIVSGNGAGQWATITNISSDGHILWVDKPWAVVPNPGSHYATFDWSSFNWIIAGNTMSDNAKGIEFFDASVRDILITNNTMNNDGEILFSPTEQPDNTGLFNLLLNIQVNNNTVNDTNHLRPAAISFVPREDRESSNFGTAVIGAEMRGNAINAYSPNTYISDTQFDDSKAQTEGFNLYWQWQTGGNFQDTGTPSLLGTIAQGNTLTNSRVGFLIDSGSYQTVLAYNNTNAVDNFEVDQALLGTDHASVQTVNLTQGSNSGPVSTPIAKSPTPVSPPSAPVAPVSAQPTANQWSQVTVGSTDTATLPDEPGTDTSFQLRPSPARFGNGLDSFSILARQRSSDTELMAQITIPSGASSSAQGAVLFRASTSADSPFVSVGLNKSGQFAAQYRASAGGNVSSWQLPIPSQTSSVWVRLGKSGPVFRTAYSLDGQNWSDWTQIGVPFESSTFIAGLLSSSDRTSDPPIVFDNVSLP